MELPALPKRVETIPLTNAVRVLSLGSEAEKMSADSPESVSSALLQPAKASKSNRGGVKRLIINVL
jgi:hypothetical protein